MKKAEKVAKNLVLVDTDGNAWNICGVFIRRRSNDYGYDLCVSLVNGETKSIAYATPEERNLPKVRNFIADHMLKGQNVDLRKNFRKNSEYFGWYGSTILDV